MARDRGYGTRWNFPALFKALGWLILCVTLASCVPHQDADLGPEPSVQPSRIAITIDDLPYAIPSRTSPADGLRDVQRINAALAKHGITATGFTVGGQITPEATPALQTFADAGHTIGNHSWSHPDYGTLSVAEFESETRRTDTALAPWLGPKSAPRYYRFPFLREGETEEAKAGAAHVLRQLGYTNVRVTIDTDDWRYNDAYLTALRRNNTTKAARIAQAYIRHIQERTAHFQTLAQTELGRDTDHILLLHLNRINADHLGTLLDWYAAQGWTFITVEQALKDPVFTLPDRFTGPKGLSQIEYVLGGPSEP